MICSRVAESAHLADTVFTTEMITSRSYEETQFHALDIPIRNPTLYARRRAEPGVRQNAFLRSGEQVTPRNETGHA